MNTELEAYFQRIVNATNSLCGTSFEKFVPKDIHDALLGYTGLTRDHPPTTFGGYMVGIAVCARYIGGESEYMTGKSGLPKICAYLENPASQACPKCGQVMKGYECPDCGTCICPICGEIFGDVDGLRDHYDEKHPDDLCPYCDSIMIDGVCHECIPCPNCGSVYDQMHDKCSNEDCPAVTCPWCGDIVEDGDMLKHYQENHPEGICPKCGKCLDYDCDCGYEERCLECGDAVFDDGQCIMCGHKETCPECGGTMRNGVCLECGYKDVCPICSMTMLRGVCAGCGYKDGICPECDEIVSPDDILKHYQEKHPEAFCLKCNNIMIDGVCTSCGYKDGTCPKCGATFDQSNGKCSDEDCDMRKCPICHEFVRLADMQAHYKENHPEAICPYCDSIMIDGVCTSCGYDEFAGVTCPECGSDFLGDKCSDEDCDMRRCPICNVYLPWDDMQIHYENEHPEYL